MPASLVALLPLAALVALVSALITGAIVVYGHRRLADQPGQHRSHTTPTPRGGGLGVAATMVASLAGAGAALWDPSWSHPTLPLALAAVALVGLIDDWRGLPVAPRLLVHALAAAALVATAVDAEWSPGGWPLAVAWPLTTLAVLWSINLHNFMDGSNGLLALQSLFVFSVVAALALVDDRPGLLMLAGLAAAATLAFLPFNFPVARVFLGDVGSGTLGLLVAACLLLTMRAGTLSLSGALMLASVFAVDATLTLLSRVVRGRRWHLRHREHLYQWLIRSGQSHPRVALLYFGFNLLLVLPAVLATRALDGPWRWSLASLLIAAEIVVWWQVKRRILAALRTASP